MKDFALMPLTLMRWDAKISRVLVVSMGPAVWLHRLLVLLTQVSPRLHVGQRQILIKSSVGESKPLAEPALTEPVIY